MSNYHHVYLNFSPSQKEKILKAIKDDTDVTLKLSKENMDDGGDLMLLTKAQVEKLKKAYEQDKGVNIKLSKTQLKHNKKVEGGFLPALLAMLPAIASKVGPALALGALSGTASALASKATRKVTGEGMGQASETKGDGLFLGRGMYLVKGGCIACQIEPEGEHNARMVPLSKLKKVKRGDGLYLGAERKGRGLFLKQEKVGSGLLFGDNSPFKNIPLLGYLL